MLLYLFGFHPAAPAISRYTLAGRTFYNHLFEQLINGMKI
jgi:hypothetical protein